MSVVVNFPGERARRPGEDIPAIVAVLGSEIRAFVRPRPVPAPEPLAAPAQPAVPHRPFARRRPVAPLSEDQKQEPLARSRGLSAQQTCDEINILLKISDRDLAFQMLVALLGASTTHKPLPYGWPKVMYAIRGRVSLHFACGRTDSDRLLVAIRQLLAEEWRTVRA
jgi:hypothetical protein